MTKVLPTALVKCSSRLLGNEKVVEHLRNMQNGFALRFIGGGGEQINQEFKRRGWKIKFGPFGRICETHEQRLVAADILEQNAALFEDQLKRAGISSVVIVPVLKTEVGGVTCHVNGDYYPIICYNGYDAFFVYTSTKDVERKERFYAAAWQMSGMHLRDMDVPETFTINATDFPSKIEVVGFDL